MKIFDYKFILIIILTLLLYFMYRKIERIEHDLNKIKSGQVNNEPIENTNNVLELPLPPLTEEEYTEISQPDVETEMTQNDYTEMTQQDNHSENNHSDNQYSDVYSNDETGQTDDVHIYSNDNDDDKHSSIIESINVVQNDDGDGDGDEDDDGDVDVDEDLNNLLKNNKLPELQQMAEELNISILRENSTKKKTKLELANDIVSISK